MSVPFSGPPGGTQSRLASLAAATWLARALAPLSALVLLLMIYPYIFAWQRSTSFSMDQIGWLLPQGVYPTERLDGQAAAARWTSGDMRIALPNPGGDVGLQLTMRGRPNGTPGVTIYAGGMYITLDVGPATRRYYLLLPPADSERIQLLMTASTEVIADRPIGVLIRDIRVFGSGTIVRTLLPLAALMLVISYALALRVGRSPWLVAGGMLAALLLLLLWHAVVGWSYAVTGGALLLAVMVGLAAMAYEPIAAAGSRRRHIFALGAAALSAAALPWLVGRSPESAAALMGVALFVAAAYTWLRGLGMPRLGAYGGALALGGAAMMVQSQSGLAPLGFALSVAGFSLSWLVLNAVPRREQAPLARLAVDVAWLCLFATIVATVGAHAYLWKTPVSQSADIYMIWRDSVRIAGGRNPYARVLGGNMQQNNKYATYFPLFYLLGALVDKAGLQSFSAWVGLWRAIFLACNMGVTLIIFLMLQRDRPLLAWVAAAFWALNRWTIQSAVSVDIDFLAIFFLILALVLLHRHQRSPKSAAQLPWAALLSLSASLAVKQIAIFIAPLFVIWAWNAASACAGPRAGARWRPARHAVGAALVLASLPLLFAFPFLAWNAKGFILSILFSATRNPNGVSIGSILGNAFPLLSGAAARMPMLLLLLGIYIAAWRRQIPLFSAGLLAMAVFVDLNMTFFNQYLTWLMPLMPLLACDLPPPRAAALERGS